MHFRRCLVLPLLALMVCSFVQAQDLAPATATATVSSPVSSQRSVTAIVEAAIDALGGRAVWQQLGAATAAATITPPGLQSRQVNWIDDWSTGRARFRREGVAGSTAMVVVGTDATHNVTRAGGRPSAMPRDNSIISLALGYPGPALILSGSQYGCVFTSAPQAVGASATPQSGDFAVMERCPDPTYPGGFAQLNWKFSASTSLPLSVELPIWGQEHRLLRTETVRFAAFSSVQGAVVPTLLEIKRVSGRVDQVSVAGTSFTQTISAGTFALN